VNRYSSNELIRGIRKRDFRVLSYIYSKYYQSVKHFVINNSGTVDDAKDIFQDAMIVVFEAVRKDKNFTLVSSMQTYIFSIARLIWIKHLNKLNSNIIKLNESHEYVEFEEPQPFFEFDFKYALYQRIFLDLPEDCQRILKMANKGWCNKKITESMKLNSEKYIAKRKHFCKEYLIKLIKEDPDFHSDKL